MPRLLKPNTPLDMSVKRLLFVDDNADFLGIVQTILGGIVGEKWEIYTAQNAGMALQVLQDNQIDLVVVDMHMPVVDGFQFLALLTRKHPNLPKAVMTSDVSEAHRAACLSRGAEAFLQKPALRFNKTPHEHQTMMLADPSGNVVEFKCYVRPECSY